MFSLKQNQTINDEYLSLLNRSISGLLKQYLGAPQDLGYLPSAEFEPTEFARSLSDVFSQLEKVQQWAEDRVFYLNSLKELDTTTKEQALWGLTPCPLSLVELAQLLQQVSAPVLGDIGRSYIPALLLGVASVLGNLLHSSMYLIALHNRATNKTSQEMPTESEIWQSLKGLIERFNKP